MRVVDTNVLLYAVNADAQHHEASRVWLDDSLRGDDVVGFSWIALLAFVRLCTNPRIFASPLTAAQATEQTEAWIGAPSAHVLHPGERHSALLASVLSESGVAGNLVNDAHLAALALEHRGSIVSYDTDFARFRQVRWHRPDELLS